MNEKNYHLIDTMSYLYYGQSAQMRSQHTRFGVPPQRFLLSPDVKSSEIMKFGLPFFRNHHYIAVPFDQSSPQWSYYQSQPDCSMFQSAVKLYSFKVLFRS